MALQASCPACGAQVLFKTGSSVVVVCDFCHSVVARTDRGLEDLGKTADVVESGSPLEVSLRGVYVGVAFELTGRAQLGHAAGGFWDEWYAHFADGRWGWLAEAQGRFYLTFQIQVPRPALLPPFDALGLGQPVAAIPAQVPPVVAEKGTARALAAEGEIPYRLTPGETYAYADLSGQGGVFGTLDYSEQPPLVFVGREVTLAELGLAGAQRTRESEPRRVAAAQLNCPHCGGPLELRAPDRTERVTCPNCGSLLDLDQGQLRFLKALETKGPAPSVPLGATAEFEGRPLTVIGFMVRSVEFEGVRYFWQEYLLYNPAIGFRWLVESDGHWSYVKSVPPGEVTEAGGAQYGGKRFKIFQDATARVEYVQGEFYWKVSVGEQARATDYVAPPLMLSKEIPFNSGAQGTRVQSQAEEINWSLGAYVPLKEIERKFGVNLPSPHTVAPNQVWPHKKIYVYWLALMAVALLAGLFTLATGSRTTVFTQSYVLQPTPTPTPTPAQTFALPTPRPGASASELVEYERLKAAQASAARLNAAPPTTDDNGSEKTQVIFTEPIQLRGRRNIRITGTANVQNNWLYVAGDLIDEQTGLVQQFDLPMESYSGVEDGEAWSEGDREQAAYLPALPEGRYTMRLEAQWENWNQPAPPQFSVRVEQGVPRIINLLFVLAALSIVPLLFAWRHFSFERRRWADSAFNPYGSGGSSGDDDGGGSD
jgi:DNA-directed RNA polymerase subunit RPC12/RpoP